MQPLVSILIPAYNAERYIAQSIESALNQTWPNKEIIVVDDGSKDRTFEISKGFERRGVKVIPQENKGHCAAANRGFSESKGELIKFFDADDLMSPENIELQIEALDRDYDSIASSEWGRFYRDDISTYKPNPETVWRHMPPVDWLVGAWRNAQPMMQCAIFLIPRRILEKSSLWDERLSLIDDFEFFTRVILASKGIKFTPGAKLYYRSGISGGSLSGLQTREGAESAYLSIGLGTSHLLKVENSSRTRLVCANVYQNFIYSFYPKFKDLIQKASQKVYEHGGADIAMPASPSLQFISRLLGWKAAKYLQYFLYQIGYKQFRKKLTRGR